MAGSSIGAYKVIDVASSGDAGNMYNGNVNTGNTGNSAPNGGATTTSTSAHDRSDHGEDGDCITDGYCCRRSIKSTIDIWDKRDRLIVCLSLASAGLAIADEHFTAVLLCYISIGLALWIAFTSEIPWNVAQYWRSLPLYAIDVVATIVYSLHHFHPQHIEHIAWSGILTIAVVQIVFALLAALCLYFFSLPSAVYLPGKHKLIGTTSLVIPMDTATKERHPCLKEFDRNNNSIPLQIWFPMEPHPNLLVRWYERFFQQRAVLWTSGSPSTQAIESTRLIQQISKNYTLPSLISGHLTLSRVNSLYQPDLQRLCHDDEHHRKFPIAIYSHGMYGWRQINSSLCEVLASQGFIVIACDHFPDCMLTRPSDAAPSEWQTFDFTAPKGCSDVEERLFYGTGVNRRVNDVKEIIDWVSYGGLVGKFPPLQGRLDLNRINLWGHSFGGGTITALSCIDDRIDKVVALDGWIYPIPECIRCNGIQSASILNLSASDWPFGQYQVPFRRDYIARTTMNKRPMYDMFIRGTDHQNFCDTYLIASKHLLRRPKVLGKGVEPRKLMKELERIIPIFFACEDYGRQHRIIESFDEQQQQGASQELFPALDVESSTGIELLSVPGADSQQQHVYHASDIIDHFSLLRKADHPYASTLKMTQKTRTFINNFVVHESSLQDWVDYTYFKKFNP